jgi:prolyl oligopeptidase
MYTWIKSADNMDPSARLNPKTKLHTLGTDPKTDIDFFSNEKYQELGIEEKSYPWTLLSKDSKDYIFGFESSVQNEFKAFYAPCFLKFMLIK